jgi:Cu/Ag efflux protein CusF
LKAVAVDSDALDDTYEDFLKNFTNARKQMKKQGKQTKKVKIIVSNLVNVSFVQLTAKS